MPDSQPKSQIELLDFGSETPSARLSYAERVVHDGVGVSRCTLQPNPGTEIGATQFTVAIHEGTPFQMEWRLPEMRETERRRIVSGDLHVNSGDRPIFQRWTSSPRILVIAMEQAFIKQIVGEAFDGKELELRTQIGIRDPVIEGMAAAWRRELAERGAGGRLYTEGLGSALAVHVFRAYGDGLSRSPPVIGGLGALRLRRVVDYIEAHLADDISLSDLAGLAGLSTHHFGEAFKASTGTSPHRYLIERRILRAKELLLGAEQSIAEIAISVGFASHSHFTDNFRKLTGTTPSRFRIDRT
ncbi:helix-turn-helix domain-containing protein [Oceanibaculum nanhaiense]|jgi:AraC family transcriptional regulator|uniref:helix-turn-helix domain-containing protein n=1 Tax=Oceanibaculum nanhaiense TaxID=1909734 RepID=UPI0015946304|nr:AraC family transcriptional regulator [Oceanibaculum nanhaiense]